MKIDFKHELVFMDDNSLSLKTTGDVGGVGRFEEKRLQNFCTVNFIKTLLRQQMSDITAKFEDRSGHPPGGVYIDGIRT